MIKLIIGLAISVSFCATSAYAKEPKEGVYFLTGFAAGSPSAVYHGSVTVEHEGATYNLKWKIGAEQTQSGVAILTKDVLSVGYYDDSGKDFGVVAYTVKSPTKMDGLWAPLGAPRAGKETLEWMGPESEATRTKLRVAIMNSQAEQVRKRDTLENLENRLALETDPEIKFYLLSGIVRHYAVIKLKDKKIAKERAEEVLKTSGDFKKSWNYGNAIHHANLVLGRLSLMDGDKSDAKKFLKAAGQTPGSPQLSSFGPNMTLAKELLEKGEKSAVLDYFADVQKFWDPDFAAPAIAKWKASVDSGKTPEFGGNLSY
jgi:hypothetical protein